MKIENYYKKNGKVYGVSYKYDFGWKCYCIEFDNLTDAECWLDTEEGDFRERELTTKTAVIKQWGKDVFDARIIKKARNLSEDLWMRYISNVEHGAEGEEIDRVISKIIHGKWRGKEAEEYIYRNRNKPWDMCPEDFLDFLRCEGDYAD